MRLSALIDELRDITASGDLGAEVTDVESDSRRVQPGALYCALRGSKSDGLAFVDQALSQGAVAVLAEAASTHAVPWLRAGNARRAMAEAAAVLHGRPSRSLRVAGVTGTNGKTTTAFLIHHLFKAARHRAGLIGTVRYDDGITESKATHTTPESPELQRWLARMRDHGCAGVAMEVSSHALVQSRAHAIEFDAAVFTNLTQDHLDFHHTMEEYFKAKELFFEGAATQGGAKSPTAVINVDDPHGRRLATRFESRLAVTRFGLGFQADFRASNIRFDFSGTTFQLEVGSRKLLVRLPLIGRFNVYNSLAALAAAHACGLNLRESVKNLALSPQVPGRLESLAERRPYKVFVDYAHTPDALENALLTLRELNPRRLITVFGCGGDRDRDKRPRMGAVADRLSHHTIVTSDNPRSEDPLDIIADIRRGFQGSHVESIPDRREAIGRAVTMAAEGDVVIIAGKGHEDYQIFADRTIDFDDRRIARRFIEERISTKGYEPHP